MDYVRNQWFASLMYMTELKWAPLQAATIMSKQIWDQIPENIQQYIRKSSEESELLLREEIRGLDDKPKSIQWFILFGVLYLSVKSHKG